MKITELYPSDHPVYGEESWRARHHRMFMFLGGVAPTIDLGLAVIFGTFQVFNFDPLVRWIAVGLHIIVAAYTCAGIVLVERADLTATHKGFGWGLLPLWILRSVADVVFFRVCFASGGYVAAAYAGVAIAFMSAIATILFGLISWQRDILVRYPPGFTPAMIRYSRVNGLAQKAEVQAAIGSRRRRRGDSGDRSRSRRRE